MQKNNPIKNILFDCERMKYPHTGLYHFCLHLGQALMRNMNPAYEKVSFYMPAKAGKLFGNGACYISQSSLHKFLFPSVKEFEVWHCTNQESDYKPDSNNLKEVLTIHDLNFLYEHQARPKKIEKSLRKMQSQINRTDQICTISEYVKADIQKHLQLQGKPIDVIYNGCNIDSRHTTQQPKYVPGKPYIFTLGTITPKKNFHVLPALLRNNDLQLIISGILLQEEYKLKIIGEAMKHGVQDKIIFTGAISDNDKHWYYNHCEAFIFPSIAEGFGLPVIEAMAFGKPVFLSTATSLPEIGGNLAYYFQSFDADDMQQTFQKGLEHYQFYKPEAAIRKRAETFSWDNAALQYIKIYKSF